MIARSLLLLALLPAGLLPAVASTRQPLTAVTQESAKPQDTAKPQDAVNDVSGTYTFLRDGEFLQLTVEDGKLSGYVSRFGELESDKGAFIDQFFDKTTLDGNHLTFNTKTVHGVWYDFTGVITTTTGKKPDDEGYRVIKGTLIQHTTVDKGNAKVTERQVEFKSFPADLGKP